MQANLLQGLYLMLVGMGFVLAFLSVVVVCLNLLARFKPKPQLAADVNQKQSILVEDTAVQAAITAAVHTYRKRHRSKD